MPPKGAKKGADKKADAAAVVSKTWEADLCRAQFEEDSWQACVSFVVGGSQEDKNLVKALALAVQQPQRQLFSLVSWESTLTKIHELGNPKTKKPEHIPMYYEVTEPAKVLLDAGEEISCDLMAKLLKFQLLHIKVNDQHRRQAEQSKNSTPSASKSSDKKGRTVHSPVRLSKEKKTKLKSRDEPLPCMEDEPDDGPQHYIVVMGFYQPQLIGILDSLGVQVANVIKLSSEHRPACEVTPERHTSEDDEQSQRTSPVLDAEAASVPLSPLARSLELFWSGLRPFLDSAPLTSKLHSVALLSYNVPDLSPTVQQGELECVLELGSQIFAGVANLIYDTLEWRRQHEHYIDNMKFIVIPGAVGPGLHHTESLHTPYHMSPHPKKCVHEEPPLEPDAEMRYYNSLLNLVPPEACSVPLILHSMLEQVVISMEQSDQTHSPAAEKGRADDGSWLDCQLAGYMLQNFLPLVQTEVQRGHMLNSMVTTVLSDEDRKRLVERFGAEVTQKTSDHPVVLRHHDERALRLRDVGAFQGFDPAEVELSMLKGSPVWETIRSVGHPKRSSSCWMAVRQQLQHYCTDEALLWPEVERLFHQSVFEAMPLTGLDQDGVLQTAAGALERTRTIIPWDNPLTFAQQQLHNLRSKGPTALTEEPGITEFSERGSCQLDLSDIQSCRLRSLIDWHYAEHHSASSFPQVLQVASEEYRCLDTVRGSFNDNLYIFCHNPRSPSNQCKEFWDVALHTDVTFRKYLENVADKILDWITEEKLKREARLAESFKGGNTSDSAEEDTVEPYIRKGSLKDWQQEQEHQKVEEMAKKSKRENVRKDKKPKEETKLPDNKNKNRDKTLPGGKRHKADTAGSSAKTPRGSAQTPVEENKDLHETEEQSNGFVGFSMDGKLIHVSGCLHNLFPSDGGHITAENISYVEGSSLMKLIVKKDGHHFCTYINQIAVYPEKHPSPHHHHHHHHESNGRRDDGKVLEPVDVKRVKQGSLSAVLHNGIHLSYSFYGPSGEYRETEAGAAEGAALDPNRPSSIHHAKATDLDSVPFKKHHSRHQKPQPKVCEEQPPASPSSSFNSLNLSVPNGLLLQILKENDQGVPSDEQGVLVRQTFPLDSTEEVRHVQDSSLLEELSRVVTSQGTVIRYMRDGSAEVLFADGTVSSSQDCGPVWVADSDVEEETPEITAEDNTKEHVAEKTPDAHRGCWSTTTPSGARISTVGTTHTHLPTTPLLTFTATDPITHEVMLSREDLVVSVHTSGGSLSVEHADGTRITSLYQERPSNTGEHQESVTLQAPSVCAESACDDTPQTQDAFDGGDEISCDSAVKVGGAEEAHANFSPCEQVCDERERDEGARGEVGEASASPGETVAEVGETCAAESRQESASTKERVVLVEKDGCATVAMYPERRVAHVFLADGTVITGNSQAAYQVFPSNAGLLQIQRDGKCVYSSDPFVTPSPKGGNPTNQPGLYTFSHTDKVACDITDPEGNHFQVMADGQISVLNVSPAPSTPRQEEEELEEQQEEEEPREVARGHVKHRDFPRLFLVHGDGSGTELLSAQTAEELLYQAYSDPTVAVLKEPLPDTQDDFGITILKPGHQGAWSQWRIEKQHPDITPPNLRNRSWQDFPIVEKKSPGPPFGIAMGRGLAVGEGSGGFAVQCQPVRSCPKILEMRELFLRRPCTPLLKNTIDAGLKRYVESLMEGEQRSEDMNVKDPRSEEESAHAADLLNLVLSFTEEDNTNGTFDKRTSVDMTSLYSQGAGAQLEQSYGSENTAAAAGDRFSTGRDSKWTERLANYRHEVFDEKVCRVALKGRNIVPYFHPENIPLYQDLLQTQTPKVRGPSVALCPIPKPDRADAPQHHTPQLLYPTLSRSASPAAGRSKMRERRPTEPTPQTTVPPGESSTRGPLGPYKSLLVDVTGKPRRTKVRLPTSLLSAKPYSIPNQQFRSVEEPVRRRCRVISLTDPNCVVRGFHLLPSIVDFGTVAQGSTATVTVAMKNVGVDTCRFHVKQPRPATGIRVIYNPGPVAAGLQVELHVQLFAMCATLGEVEPQKRISQDIIIHTETDILYLPVTAIIRFERLFDDWIMDHSSAHIKKGSM